MRAAAVGVAVAVGVGHVAARYAGARRVAGVLKAIPIAILAMTAAFEAAPVSEAYRRLVVVGLLSSLAGDVWLVFPRGFVPGLACFLVAHVLYIAAFAPAAVWSPQAALLGVGFALFAVGMFARLAPGLGRERLPVAVYVATIATMGWCAAVRAGSVGGPSGALALAGALLFMVSDGVLAIDRFVRRFAAADAVVMTTYYAAQILIALSVRA
jgi:uncharacterized membrane protein YhhN